MKLFTSLLRLKPALALTFLMFFSSVDAANLVSSVNRNSINSGQIITLSVSYDKQVSGASLNIDSLNRDFDVLSITPQSSSSTSFVNGKVTKEESTVWKITLAAKREGEITIPAFDINGDKSDSIIIKVEDSSASSNAISDLTVTARADNQSVYESQQIILEVELSAAQGLSGFNGSKFNIENAQIKELGQDNKQKVDNGIVRNIFILSYAIFPEKAGTLRIPPITFTARKGRQRSFFGDTGGEQVIARSKAFNINVKPADTTHAPWFPSADVEISAKWSGDTSAVIAGEPITRTLTIFALGQEASGIPPLVRGNEDGYKSYKDQAQLDTKTSSKGYVSSRVESEAIVVSTPGKFTLPAIDVHWWDINENAWKKETIEEQILTVLPATNTEQQQNSFTNPALSQDSRDTYQTTSHKSHWLWPVISAALLLICLLQGYFLWRLSNQTKTLGYKAEINPAVTENEAWSVLTKALKSNDSTEIRQALGQWAQTLSSDQKHVSITALATYSNDTDLNNQLKQSITQLEMSLYNKQEQASFDSSTLKTLVNTLRKVIKNKGKTSHPESLTPLYKN